MNRTSFLIDGFNLYHSAKKASNDLGLNGRGTKWLDIASLCSSYLHLIGNDAELGQIFYFSALATHLQGSKPGVTARHQSFIRCLSATGVIAEMGRFKRKEVICNYCRRTIQRHEEKETDVAIAVKLLELCFLSACDTLVVMTGDTDIAPAVRTANRLFPDVEICFLFPYGRKNGELARLVKKSYHIRKEVYVKHQFTDPYVSKDAGLCISKPAKW